MIDNWEKIDVASLNNVNSEIDGENTDFFDSLNSIQIFSDELSEKMKLVTENIGVITSFLQNVSDILNRINITEYMKNFSISLNAFVEAIDEVNHNPNSTINYFMYLDKLDDFHWAWPYEITPEELKELIEKSEDEKYFDKLMMSFFTKERVHKLLDETESIIPKHHKVIYKQIIDAYQRKGYALSNNALMSVMDNMLSSVLNDKGCLKRVDILQSIIKFYVDNYDEKDVFFIFTLQMLSNNLNLLFENYKFNNKVKLETNKKIRRHLSVHGVAYSNRKIDSVMLLNTLYQLLLHMKYLQPFRNSLGYKKHFYIITREYVIKNRIMKQLKIKQVLI